MPAYCAVSTYLYTALRKPITQLLNLMS